ncbi:MAG: carbon storage regulator CsrA [Planctomycetaceae bacterium]|nr:carbon storage regulator CsrA [Planctomycetaceae bacterium]
MLVLSRKSGEKIRIGDDVAITVVRIGPNTVRLGIEAPRDMSILREELCETEAQPRKDSGMQDASAIAG